MASENGSQSARETVRQAAGPILRFVGHALAVAVGLVFLTPILLIPVILVKLLGILGFTEIGSALRIVEVGLLYAELGFFALTLTIGAVELILCECARALGAIRASYRAARER